MSFLFSNLNKRHFFSFVGLFFMGLVLISVILAISGLFYVGVVFAYITIGIVILAHLFIKNKLFSKINRSFWAILLVSLGFTLLFSVFSIPTIFSGRDQGSYSEAAIRLSQNHKLKFSTPASEEFFKIYGPGKALNFPGFNYTNDGNLTTQFALGYISWLAVFYSFFGLSGLIAANAVSFFIFALSFYFLSRLYLQKIPAFASYSLLLTSFIFSWFFKFTLSENLALGIIFFGLYQFVTYLKNSEKLFLFSSLFSFFVLLFARIEGLAFLAVIFLILFIRHKKDQPFKAFLKDKKIIFSIVVLVLIYFWNVFSSLEYYKVFAKGFLHSFSNIEEDPIGPKGLLWNLIYTTKILGAYALLTYIIIGILALIYFIRRKKYDSLMPFFIVFPSFIYLIQSSISSDHPWMLRRFVFSIVPICILYSIMFLYDFFKKKYFFYILFFLLFLSNLIIFVPSLAILENDGLLGQVENISANFEKNDLILVDQKATGSGWSMMTGPMNFLYNKQAVYFFRPNDLDRLDLNKFSHIYFIIPDDNLDLYEKSGLIGRLQPIKDYAIETTGLDIRIGEKSKLYSQPVELPAYQKAATYGKIYILK